MRAGAKLAAFALVLAAAFAGGLGVGEAFVPIDVGAPAHEPDSTEVEHDGHDMGDAP